MCACVREVVILSCSSQAALSNSKSSLFDNVVMLHMQLLKLHSVHVKGACCIPLAAKESWEGSVKCT